MELEAMRQAERAMRAEETAAAVRVMVEGSRMGQYLPLLGKKKNERVFWVSLARPGLLMRWFVFLWALRMFLYSCVNRDVSL
jgi:hypothetical protein